MPAIVASVPPSEHAPTRVRFGVLGFACALSMITYLDRVCIASAARPIGEALGLTSEADLKWAFTAFTIAYAVFEIPTGWLGDVFGPRRVLIRIVLWWSVFTALTGLVGMPVEAPVLGLGSLITIRFLFGLGEAGAYPNLTRALHNWFPFSERGFAQGMVWMGGRLMGGLTPFLWTVLVQGTGALLPPLLHWRATFWMFGVFGLAWCLAFSRWFRNRPEEKPQVNTAEIELIHAGRPDLGAGHAKVPWLRLLKSKNLWALCLMYFCGAFGWYFNITYLPAFMEGQYRVDPKSLVGALYKGGPLWLGAVACLAGGWLTDAFIRRTGDRKWGRRLFGVIGHSLCGVCYLACLWTPSAFTFFLAISFAAFWNDLTMGAAWAVCQDIGRQYAAIVAGCMNSIGNLGGAVAGWVTGTLLQRSLAVYAEAHGTIPAELSATAKQAGLLPGYHLNFILFAAVYAIAVLLWLRVDATEAVAGQELPADSLPIA